MVYIAVARSNSASANYTKGAGCRGPLVDAAAVTSKIQVKSKHCSVRARSLERTVKQKAKLFAITGGFRGKRGSSNLGPS